MKISFFHRHIGLFFIISLLLPAGLSAEMQGKGREGRQGRCPICGGMTGGQCPRIDIPERLPAPKNEEWAQNLRQAHALEKYATVQYEADSKKHNAAMPYHMIIPQENNHIVVLEELFFAYGLPPDKTVPAVKQTSSIEEAYGLGYNLERDLIIRYEWLVKNAEDETGREVLDFILLQTRMHATMFLHAMRMTTGGMRSGMMHQNMMH